ncbi:MAG: nuclear transport factor 2 family protein [Pseudomonadota bacterium]
MFKTLIYSLLVVGTVSAPVMPNPIEIERSITDIAAGADRADWPRVRSAFADTVTVDYTSLWGGDPVTQPADDLVAGWAAFLPGFDATHHIVTNHTITEQGEAFATAEADFTATHRIEDELWVLGGRYMYEFTAQDGRWLVTSLTMTALWEDGDRALVAEADARAATSE